MEIDDQSMIAFGQYYPKAGRCHLARLVVAPAFRGRGYGERLIRYLCRSARTDLGLDTYSLYVMQSNEIALRLYERLGFVVTEAPEVLPRENEPILFMVAQGEAASALSDWGWGS
jgi:ribosomal protein S18 acetylase RimI-like enzyme